MNNYISESIQYETENKLAGVLDSLESKFGETAVMSGALWQRFHGDNGMRRKRSELKSAVDAREDAPLNTADDKSSDDAPSNTSEDTSTNEDARATEKKEPKKF